MSRTLLKGLRDLAVIAVGTALLALAERAVEFGVPIEIAPIVSAAALALYRLVRDAAVGQPA